MRDMSGIQHEWTLNSVTALGFYRSLGNRLLLLVGEGVHLKVFDPETSTLITQCRVFDSQTIHGLAIKSPVHTQTGGDLSLAIWGGRSFVLLDSSTVEVVVSCDVRSLVSFESTAADWILDGAVSPFSAPQACAFVTAHCALLYAHFSGKGQHPRLEPLSSLSQSILYSAHVVWTSATAVLVAAGTVFGEIEVIAGHLASEKGGVSSRRLVTYTGHEGSVFGVQISQEIIDLDGRSTRLLASCSDDRTIRVWDVSAYLCEGSLSSEVLGASAPLQETGFLADGNRLETNKLRRGSVAAVMGHLSRIWRVLFLTSNTSALVSYTEVNILSFGEDATCQQWSLEKFGTETTLTHVNTFSFHSGKNIWAAALLPDEGNRYFLTTGGADGKVSLYSIHVKDTRLPKAMKTIEFRTAKAGDITEVSSPTLAKTECLTLEEILSGHLVCENGLSRDHSAVESSEFGAHLQKEVIPPIQRNPSQDTLNRYCFVTRDELLITTSFGKVLLGSVRQPHSWHELKGPSPINQDLKSYSVVLGIPQCNTAILAGANGAIYMYRHGGEVKRIHKAYNKVAALFNVSNQDADLIRVIITTLGSAEAQLISVQPPLSPGLIPNIVLKLILPPKFIVTSAGCIRDLLVLGSRNGSLAVYDQVSSNESLYAFYDENSKRDAITTIINIPSASASAIDSHLLVTSRNGSYSIFLLSAIQTPHNPNNPLKRISLTLVHQSVPPLGPMIEAAWFHDSDLMLYGFRSKNFIVWNESKHCEVTSVDCGGAHRSYAYSPIPGADGAGIFAYTKASKLHLHSQSRGSHNVTKHGGHGREIKTCAVLGSGKQKLIATGSEDTTIRIWSLKGCQRQSGDSFQCHNVIEKHTTGIQHLHWCRYQDCDGSVHYLFSSGGNEEFFVWAVSPIPNFGFGVVCEATLTYQSEEHDLRIMNFDAVIITPQESISQIPGPKFRLTLTYSDSTIRVYEYSRVGGFRKLTHSCYTSNCLTQVASLRVEGWHDLLFTAATDGYLALWEFRSSLHGSSGTHPRLVPPSDLDTPVSTTSPEFEAGSEMETPELTLLSRTKFHQSSVSALDILPLSFSSGIRGPYVIATGGDDNSLSLALFSHYRLVQRIVVPSAHAAAITGIEFVKGGRRMHEETDRNLEGNDCAERWYGQKLITVGADQRVKLWRIEFLCTGGGYLDGETQELSTGATKGRYMRVGKMKEGDNAWCSVADVAGLVTFRTSPKESSCLVYGAGIEMFSVALDEVRVESIE